MKNNLVGFAMKLLALTLCMFGIHYYVIENVLQVEGLYYSLPLVYGFLFILTLLIYVALYYLASFLKDYVGMGFLVGIVFKMLATFILFLPMINADGYNYLADILNFFIPYFIFLIFETISAVKLINKE